MKRKNYITRILSIHQVIFQKKYLQVSNCHYLDWIHVTDVNIAITFTALLNKSVLDYVTFGNATSVTLDGNVITITLDRTVSSKSYVTIPKTTKTGETVVVSSPNTYVQNQDNSAANYILRYQAAGADITLTFDNRDYTVVYNVVS